MPFDCPWSPQMCFTETKHFVFATRCAARRWFGDVEDDDDEYQTVERDLLRALGDDPDH